LESKSKLLIDLKTSDLEKAGREAKLAADVSDFALRRFAA
tara:strand:+ start:513 stop:632 length:120 start_codon:yes stop_codon:yes gene_type:complete